jgi:GH15 family glucan-1,4-alpha-glucosidase
VLQDANVVERYGGPCLTARMTLGAGEYAFVAKWDNDDARTSVSDSRRQLQTTLRTWERWLHKDGVSGDREWAGSWREHVKRSELALKLLTYADTGAIAAAATTSLPETIGGVRNWDYRFTWIRDAALTAQALYALGHDEEAKAFIHWAERVAAKHRHDDIIVRLMYGLRGETELDEEELEHLEGYRASKPVRIGNEAAVQLQLDIYGELIGAAYELVRKGDTFEADVWDFLPHLADGACSHWRQDDYGIWEMRNGPKPFVYSKAMVWTALDRAITLARDYGLDGDAGRWRKTCEEVRTELLTKGYDDKLNAFVLEYGSKDLDAANLLLPLIEFLPPDDPRVQGTIDRTFEQLTERDLVYRYKADDGLPGEEGAFVLCTFWMVDALALSGRLDEAHRIFEGVASRANHVGLLSEQIDPHSGRFLGNFPQAFSHLGLINSLLYLAYAEGRDTPVPDPVGSSEHRQQNGR